MALFTKLFSRRSKKSRQVATVQTVASPPRRRPIGHAYILVVDESASTGSGFRMAQGRTTTRMAAIQHAAQGYLRQLLASHPAQKVGLVGFSRTATLYHPLVPVGRSFDSLCRALRSLHPQSSTNLSAGLALALGQLARTGVTRGNLVVITDGAANVNPSRLPGMINRARSSGVRIFTIGVGNNGDGDYDRDLLWKMARSTGGSFASAHSFEALCNALRRTG